MAKRAASTTSPTDSSSLALNDHLSQSARRQLGALRGALESRLAALEEVLADPSRGESLAGLILDLSRVATEEAQAAASQACIEIKVEADKEIAALRSSAKAALESAQAAQRLAEATLEQERIELRRALDQAQLEIQKQSDLLTAQTQLEVTLRADRERLEAAVRAERERLDAAVRAERERLEVTVRAERERLEAEFARQQSSAADLQRAVADAQQRLETERRSNAERQLQLESERAAAAELRRSAESAAARAASLERERAEARAAHKAVAADLARERAAIVEHERVCADLQLQLEAERETVADLQQAAARTEELTASLGREASKGQEAHEEAALLEKSLADARTALAAAYAELEADRTSMNELRQAVDYADQQLASARSNEAQAVADHQKVAAQLDAMIREREAVADELTAARKWINDLREAEAEFAVPVAPTPVETPPAKTKAKAHAPTSPPKQATILPPAGSVGDEGWQPIRLASRYVFSTELMVQVNGDPARLYDLSISGCQLLSPTALKPNQMIKILLPDSAPLICAGKVVWTRLEPMGMGQPLGYRAGVRFTKADEVAIEAFAARHTTPA